MNSSKRFWKTLPLLMLYFMSCDRSSIQLPAIKSTPAELTLIGKLDGQAEIQVDLSQSHSFDHDTVRASIKNVGSSFQTNLRVIIEFCKGSQNYDNCYLQYETQVEQLNVGETTPVKEVFIDKGIELKESNINVYITSDDKSPSNNPLHGIYVDSQVEFRTGALVNNYAYLKGYIQPDGFSTFRFKISDSTFYNITNGHFYNIAGFSGMLTSNGQINAILSLDTLVASDINHKILKLRLSKKLDDSTNEIFANIKNLQ